MVTHHKIYSSPLEPIYVAENEISTFPTTTKTTYLVSLCSPLPHFKHLSDDDQCPQNTRICMTVSKWVLAQFYDDSMDRKSDKFHFKISSHRSGSDDRIISVVPVAGELGNGKLDVQASLGKKDDSGSQAPLVLKLHGGMYENKAQSAEITIECDPSAQKLTTQSHYYSSSASTLFLTFRTDKICTNSQPPAKDPDRPPSGDGDQTHTTPPSGNAKKSWGFFGTFFTLLGLGFLAYFVVGAWVQRTQYGATGWDLVPHRDFCGYYILFELFSNPFHKSFYSTGRDLPFVIRFVIVFI